VIYEADLGGNAARERSWRTFLNQIAQVLELDQAKSIRNSGPVDRSLFIVHTRVKYI
jgi:hypothetical protein